MLNKLVNPLDTKANKNIKTINIEVEYYKPIHNETTSTKGKGKGRLLYRPTATNMNMTSSGLQWEVAY